MEKITLDTLLERITRTGSVTYQKQIRSKPIITEENEFNVVLEVENNPHEKFYATKMLVDRSVRRILCCSIMIFLGELLFGKKKPELSYMSCRV